MSDPAITVIERQPGVVVVHVQPHSLDERTLPTVLADVSAAGTESPERPVVLDLANVRFMASVSLGGLVQCSREFKARGQRLALTGLQPPVRQTMAVTRLDRIFEILNDVSAIKSDPGPQK